MIVEFDRVKGQVKAIEASRPSAEQEPEGHKEANERVSRLIDRYFMYAEAERARRVPL